jgi:carboxyl-terminal processing protease
MKLRNTLLVCILVVFSGWTGFWFGEKRLKLSFSNWKPAVVINTQPTLTGGPSQGDFSLFWEVWNKVSQLYVDKADLDTKKMIDGAISGMVAAIGDPYTVYLPVKQNKETKEDLGGAFEGVGIQLGYIDKQLAVMTPLDGTPAMRAGVRSGDLILKITDTAKNIDQPTNGMSLAEAVQIIRGPKGSKVKLTLARSGVEKPFEVELVRETIIVKSVTVQYVSGTAWVKLTRFGDRTKEEWGMVVEDVVANCLNKGSECKGVVLDVRNNPGGYLEMAVYIAGEFLKPGSLVVSQQYGDGTKTDNRVDRNGQLLKVPLVVLINEGSASASEILAGALQDAKRARVVGVKSFGKGSVQQPEDFPDGSGLHVTVAKWLRPSGDWIDKKGINPDVTVNWDNASESARWEDDPQLSKAIEILK